MEHYEIGTLVPQSMMSVEEAISGVERLLDDGFILERGGDDSKRPCYRIRQNRKPIDHASPQMW